MRPDLFPYLISFGDAKATVLAAAQPIARTESVSLVRADGRVVAHDVRSSVDVPAFDRAAMDGYAVVSADTDAASQGSAAALRLIGATYTGDVPQLSVTTGTCMAIATGAPMPDGANAVVMVEQTKADGGTVSVFAKVIAGQNVGRRGADLAKDDAVVTAGATLGPARVGALAASGVTMVEVFARPTVALLSTGNEITAPGNPLPHGHVYDVNRFTVGAVVEQHGGIAVPMNAAGDTIAALTAALDAAAEHDVIVFSGGSSVGERDLMLDALKLRGTVEFHGIAVKPGKPTLFGHVGATPVFGMPGNPTSCLSNAYMLLVPFLRAVARLPPWRPTVARAPLATRISSASDRHQFYPVRLATGQAYPAFKSSGDITSMAHADGFIEIPSGTGTLDAGTIVEVTMF